MNIPVDRTSITASHKAFNRAKQDIDRGISIAIYPEATIPECSPAVGPFKNGAFKLAIEKQIPIVPITYLDNWKIFPDRKGFRFLCRPGLSRIIIHQPIETKGMGDNDVSTLRENVRELIKNTMKQNGSIG
jgi:1-acyl-sn-glycerol-3-phosphate acyltransferase